MNPGLGGGGLFTAAGTLVGLVSLDLNQVGHFTMAVPVENYLDHRQELLEHGRRVSRPRRAWVGLFCYELHDHVVVGGVFPGAPGERAGLRPGDVILRVEDEAIGERRALYRRLGSYDPGTRLTFDVFRDRAIQRVEVLTEDAEVFFA
jgi:S1-C subfamily serine protease